METGMTYGSSNKLISFKSALDVSIVILNS